MTAYGIQLVQSVSVPSMIDTQNTILPGTWIIIVPIDSAPTNPALAVLTIWGPYWHTARAVPLSPQKVASARSGSCGGRVVGSLLRRTKVRVVSAVLVSAVPLTESWL